MIIIRTSFFLAQTVDFLRLEGVYSSYACHQGTPVRCLFVSYVSLKLIICSGERHDEVPWQEKNDVFRKPLTSTEIRKPI